MSSKISNPDPWNWKFPSRSDLMSLDKIDSKRDLVRAKTAMGVRSNRQTTMNMNTDDIRGAKPTIFIAKNPNRPEYHNSNFDIPGTRPRILHVGMQRQHGSLVNEDIEGAKPDCIKFKTKRQPQNPLNPEYKLSKVEYHPPDPPKFIRNQMCTDDIEGSKPKVKRELAQRDNYRVDDIEGAKPKLHFQRRDGHMHDQIFNDVTKKKPLQRTEPFNPQQPKYKVRDQDNKVIEIGFIPGSSPTKAYYKTNPVEMDRNLKSRDIKGNEPGSRVLGNFHSRDRRQIREANFNQDIQGSVPGTLVHGIKRPEGMKNRATNPLAPTYQFPGSSEKPIDRLNDPFGEQGCSMGRANFAKKLSEQAAAPNAEKNSAKKSNTGAESVKSGAKPPLSGLGKPPASSHPSQKKSQASAVRPQTGVARSQHNFEITSNKQSQRPEGSVKSGRVQSALGSHKAPSESGLPGIGQPRPTTLQRQSSSRSRLSQAQKLDQFIQKA